MKTRNAMALGLLTLAALTAVGVLLYRQHEQEEAVIADVPWSGEVDNEDPFAEMIEEGAGLIGQMKAEAAELAKKQREA